MTTIDKAKKMILRLVRLRRFRKIVKSGMMLSIIKKKYSQMISNIVKRRRFREIAKNGF